MALLAVLAAGSFAFGAAGAQQAGEFRLYGRAGSGFDPRPLRGPLKAFAIGDGEIVALRPDGSMVTQDTTPGSYLLPPPGLAPFKAIATGAHSVLAIDASDVLHHWGEGSLQPPGELGSVSLVVARGGNAGAIMLDGSVACWGETKDIQAAPAGAMLALSVSDDFVPTVGGSTVPLSGHALAIRASGQTVVAWGRDALLQTSVPPTLGPCLAVSAGPFHSLALRTDGRVVAWGAQVPSEFAAYGPWVNRGQTQVPASLAGVKRIAAGWFHSVAVTQAGGVVIWGGNDHGEGNASIPPNLGPVREVAAGEACTVVLLESGEVRAWGNGLVLPMEPVRAAAIGDEAWAVINATGPANGWGDGYGVTPPALGSVYAPPPQASTCAFVDAKGSHFIGLLPSGTVIAWGQDSPGLLAGLPACSAVSAGEKHLMALTMSGQVRCWGSGATEGQVAVPSNLGSAVAIAAGELHSLAVRSDGTLAAWGAWEWPLECPSVWAPAGSYSKVAGGGGLSAAIRGSGGVVDVWDCFGLESPPQLAPSRKVVAGPSHVVSLRTDGTVAAHGWAIHGVDELPPNLAGAIDVATGYSGTVVIIGACEGDLTGDGVVNGLDLGALLGAWGATGAAAGAADINRDGVVNGLDLGGLLGGWGVCD